MNAQMDPSCSIIVDFANYEKIEYILYPYATYYVYSIYLLYLIVYCFNIWNFRLPNYQSNIENTSGKETSFLDLNIKVIGSDVHTSVYDKCDDFGFPIVNFPWLRDDVCG